MSRRNKRLQGLFVGVVVISIMVLTGCKADILNRQILSQVKGTYLDLLSYVAFTIDEDGNMFRISRWGGYDYLKLRFDEMYVYYEDTNEKVLYSLIPHYALYLDGTRFSYISSDPIIPYSPGGNDFSLVGTWTDNALPSTTYELHEDGTGISTESGYPPLPCTWKSSGFGDLTVTTKMNSGSTAVEYLWYVRYGDKCYLDALGGIVG